MRVCLSVLLLASTACGGAIESKLLEGDGGTGMDSGLKSDVAAQDVTHPPDVMSMPEVTAHDVAPMIDTAPPPVDTGPPDTGPKRPPVFCGSSPCDAPANDCCVTPFGGGYSCQSAGDYKNCIAEGNTPVFCDQPEDCPGEVCCGTKSGSESYSSVVCAPTCTSTDNSKITFCNPAAKPDVCAPLGLTCHSSSILVGFNVCN